MQCSFLWRARNPNEVSLVATFDKLISCILQRWAKAAPGVVPVFSGTCLEKISIKITCFKNQAWAQSRVTEVFQLTCTNFKRHGVAYTTIHNNLIEVLRQSNPWNICIQTSPNYIEQPVLVCLSTRVATYLNADNPAIFNEQNKASSPHPR